MTALNTARHPAYHIPRSVATIRDLADLAEWFDGDGRMRVTDYPARLADIRHDNTRRAGAAALALVAYEIASGIHHDEPAVVVADLLADLQHLGDSLDDIDWDAACSRALSHHEHEVTGTP